MHTLTTILLLFYFSKCIAIRRIVGGRDAQWDEFPYVAIWGRISTENNSTFFVQLCTCSFLSPIWAITAGHCIEAASSSYHKTLIMYGRHLPGEMGNFTKVLIMYLHPGYIDSSYVESAKCDIGLMRTNRIQLPQYGVLSGVDYTTIIGHEVFVAGYGNTNGTDGIYDAFNAGKALQVFKGMVGQCGSEVYNFHLRLCVVSSCQHIASICPGDSGGPVIHSSGIVGVSSIGNYGCNDYNEFKRLHKHSLALSASNIVQAISPVVDWLSKIMAGDQ